MKALDTNPKDTLRRSLLARITPVVHAELSSDEPYSLEQQILLDLLKATTDLRACVEFLDPTTGVYRIVLIGRL